MLLCDIYDFTVNDLVGLSVARIKHLICSVILVPQSEYFCMFAVSCMMLLCFLYRFTWIFMCLLSNCMYLLLIRMMMMMIAAVDWISLQYTRNTQNLKRKS